MNRRMLCNLVCPLIVGNRLDERNTEVKQIVGTAFSLGNNYLLTAGHCLPDLSENQVFGLGYPQPGRHELGIVQVKRAEHFETHDLALLESAAPVPYLEVQKWSQQVATALAEVWSAGYPHALDIAEMGFVAQRAFKGHIVSHLPHGRLADGSFLEVYELSFIAPKGISGAPLFLQGEIPLVAGVMLGTRQTDMEITREFEASDDGRTAEFHWYIQRMHYGMALTSEALIKLRSDTLNMTIKEYLQSQGLLAD